MTNLPLPLLSITANENLTSVNLYSHWSNKDREKEKKKIRLTDISTSLPPSTSDAMEGFSLVEHADDGQIPPDSLIQEVDKTEKKKEIRHELTSMEKIISKYQSAITCLYT